MKIIFIFLIISFANSYVMFGQKKLKPTTPKSHSTADKLGIKKAPEKKVAPLKLTSAKKMSIAEIPQTLSARELEMISEINVLRADPKGYAIFIRKYLESNNADKNQRMAAQELFAELKKLKPLPPLTLDLFMYKDVRQFGVNMVKNNIFEHSDLHYAENLSLGFKNIREAICDLLIDDDIDDRGHRKNLLNENNKYVAVYECPGKVQDIEYCYIQVFK